MEVDNLRNKANKLEFAIKKAVQDFHDSNNQCELEIDITPQYTSMVGGRKFLVNTEVKVTCKI
jgi:hypothetical protein